MTPIQLSISVKVPCKEGEMWIIHQQDVPCKEVVGKMRDNFECEAESVAEEGRECVGNDGKHVAVLNMSCSRWTGASDCLRETIDEEGIPLASKKAESHV